MTYTPRPVAGYSDRGAEQFYDNVKREDNPYPDGTLAAAEWDIGWLDCKVSETEMLLCDEQADEYEYDEFKHYRSAARYYRNGILFDLKQLLPDAQTVSEAIGIPVEKWPSNCYAISCAVVNSGILDNLREVYGEPRPTYGVYSGNISAESLFAGRRIARHGWIEFTSGVVVDPTAWVFTATEPELSVANTDDYDMGGNLLKSRLLERKVPARNPDGPFTRWHGNNPDVVETVANLLKDTEFSTALTATKEQYFYLANLAPEAIGEYTPEIYRALDRMGMGAFIPVDNREHAIPPEPVTASAFKL